jgi:uncharacterized membrane protein
VISAATARRTPLKWAWGLLRLDFTGIAVGALFFCLSLTPSLLPRTWLFAGLIGGLNAAFGYGVGVLVGKALHRFALRDRSWWPPDRRVLMWGKVAVVGASILACVLTVLPAVAWQREVAALMGTPGPATVGYYRTLMVALVVGGALVATFRVLLDVIRYVARVLIRRWRMGSEVALFIGTTLVVILLVTMINGVLYRGFLAGSSRVFQPQNTTTAAGVLPPSESQRSGSPNSFAAWDTLGYQGRDFVGTGPRARDLSRVNGRPAREPVRVYAGLQTADTDESRLAVLMSELQRTRAFERKILVIVPTTGTGWVNPVAAAAVETMYNGDTALVALQYSYLPSWISFVADEETAARSGRMLIDAVQRKWATLPEGRRPILALYGESLGSLAGQSAFGYLPDISARGFDSVLWVGPPNASPLWSALVGRRDPGSTEVSPRYDGGRTVRFTPGGEPATIAADTSAPWPGTRVLFLQQSSDPIVWWSPNLVFNRPAWLTEPPGGGRSPAMRWYPFVTFSQVGTDILQAAQVPGGHGHNYGDTVLDGWVAVAAPPGWRPADTQRVRAALGDLT